MSNNYSFGARSRKNLETCHPDLIKIAEMALKHSQVDFVIVEGARSVERQQMLFDTKKSKVNPKNYTPEVLTTKGKHIVNEFRQLSDAFDICVYVSGAPKLTYDLTHLMYLIGVITTVAEILFEAGEITHVVRSGANWDRDGQLRYDQTFFDSPHLELIKPK